jgi:hypothetical protein
VAKITEHTILHIAKFVGHTRHRCARLEILACVNDMQSAMLGKMCLCMCSLAHLLHMHVVNLAALAVGTRMGHGEVPDVVDPIAS